MSKTPIRELAMLVLLLAPWAAGIRDARGEAPPIRASDLRLRAADLPAGWIVLPKEADTEEVAKLKQAAGLATKQISGFQCDFQGIKAQEAVLTVAFFGFPDEKAMKQFGPMVELLFANRRPKAFGPVYVLVLADDAKAADAILKAVGRRYAAARLSAVDALVAQGKHGEAAQLLDAVVAGLPDAPSAFVRAGDLYFYSLRPPDAQKALGAYGKAIALHARDPLDPVLLAWAWQGSGLSRLTLGEREKAAADLQKGADAARAVAPRLAARVLLDKARVHVRLNDEEGCFSALQSAFELEAGAGFAGAAAGAREDADFAAFARKSRFSTLIGKYAKVKPPDAWVPPEPPAFDPARDPLILLPPLVGGRVMPDLKLDEALEKALLAKCRGAGVLSEGAQGSGRFTWAATGAELAAAAWESVESLGCFDLRLAGSASNRGRGAELAALAADRARSAQMAFGQTVRTLAVHARVEQEGNRTEITVTAALVEEGGKLLFLAQFRKPTATSTVALRSAIADVGAEILSRFATAKK
jgi:tetratricopeptide (TPR) repeat protein